MLVETYSDIWSVRGNARLRKRYDGRLSLHRPVCSANAAGGFAADMVLPKIFRGGVEPYYSLPERAYQENSPEE